MADEAAAAVRKKRVYREAWIRAERNEYYRAGGVRHEPSAQLEQSEWGMRWEGKLADIVIFDVVSLAMFCGTGGLVGAIVLHAGTRDVRIVIVNRITRNSSGILLSSHH